MYRITLALTLLAVICRPVSAEPSDVVDRSTLTGKVMCGYQGWFNCQGDGADLGWKHWARNAGKPLAPGNVTVDLWPDLSEFAADERYQTGFKHADGRPAEAFSSHDRGTVMRHFQWMSDYGIDGAFVQRFAVSHSRPELLSHQNQVLAHARDGARESGRAYAVMYDLSGLRAGRVAGIRQDWLQLTTEKNVTSDAAYLRHNGRPLVAVWGIGFNDGRKYTVAECLDLVQWLKSQGCAVMVGVPSYWREGRNDAVDDPMLQQILKIADVVSPWSVGRYRSPEQAERHAATTWAQDFQWCRQQSVDFLPVVFPGFSWHNLNHDPLASIPRLKGEFLWAQVVAAKRVGCEMIYVAMFDEVDEGTAIFKCLNDPPVGGGAAFIGYEGLPSDFYLRLVGKAGELLRDELPVTDPIPDLQP